MSYRILHQKAEGYTLLMTAARNHTKADYKCHREISTKDREDRNHTLEKKDNLKNYECLKIKYYAHQ